MVRAFIVLEGIDGSGTTTHSQLLTKFLEEKGLNVHLTQEPSSSIIGDLLKKILLDENIPPETDALLFAADRYIHYNNEIEKKLENGYIVISDRYLESSIVYQSSQTDQISIEWIENINKFVGIPDIIIILDLPPEVSLKRKLSHLKSTGKNKEKFENLNFLVKVRNRFLERAKEKGYKIINSENSIELVQNEIQNYIKSQLKL